MEAFSIKNLSFKYPDRERFALSNINLGIKKGEFLLVIGESGSGKTTLLRMLKNELRPKGEIDGGILFLGNNLFELKALDSASKIGFITQEPEAQLVSDRVYGELAFGLENLGLDREIIRARVGEFASYFGLVREFSKPTANLSGGQKQLLNLASVMAMNPEVIILDEPTSQLDPIAAVEFLDALKRLNDDLGVTVIIAEHHLENAFKLADRVAYLEDGRLFCCEAPEGLALLLKDKRISQTLPVSARVYQYLDSDEKCPLTVKEGRGMLEKYENEHYISIKELINNEEIISCKDIWFRYEKKGEDVLRSCSLGVRRGEFYALAGENGSGKSTILKLLFGALKPYRGRLRRMSESLAYLPQNPKNLFVKDSVEEDFKSINNSYLELCESFGIEKLLSSHPYDLSGGELERAAICKLLLLSPEVLLLDEPTKGLDSFAKNELGRFLRDRIKEGITVICVTHDLDFAANYADRCGLLFDGGIICENDCNTFFSENSFYTTASSRLTKGIFKNAVTYDDILECIKAGEGK